MLTAHVVAHTHWDREWYQPFVRFRQRLVALIDELLADPPGPNDSFLLDGQGIVLEDYLDVRPERAAELASLLQSGALEAGPWYVLADALIPGGEALTRNLLLGRRVLRRLRASAPPVLYCPDSFGHPAALPRLAAGFGLPLIILWRGFGGRRWPQTDTVEWVAGDDDSAIVYHLPPNGYEYGADLPVNAPAARERWARMRAELARRAETGVVLVPNGADHHARQAKQREAVRALADAAAATGDTVRASSLTAFAEDLLARALPRNLERIQGELRDSYGYTWTLQGTFAARAAQKRHNALAERLLVREAEPWSALARSRGARSRLGLLVAAWRTLLEAQPHDTLCGCSIDAVADAMNRRLDDAVVQAIGIRDDAIADLLGHDAAAARTSAERWQPIVVVRNRAARARGGVAIVEMKQFLADVPVGPRSASAAIRRAAKTAPTTLGVSQLQPLGRRLAYDRLDSPRHYPDQDLVSVTHAAAWIDPVPGYGIVAYPLGGRPVRASAAPPPRFVRVTKDTALDNGIVRLAVESGGRISLTIADRRLEDLLVIEDRVDRGDLYTASIREAASVPEFLQATVTRRGPLLGELRLRWRLNPTSIAQARRAVPSTISVRIGLVAESPLVRLSVRGRNQLRNHRLRLGVRTDIVGGEVWADAAFGPVRREPLRVPNDDARAETPPPTAPLHRYVSRFDSARGATLLNDGLAEYEAGEMGQIDVTLLRAVGALSRRNLPERPGHAGWPAPTPKAQSLGGFAARLCLFLHGARAPDVVDAIERAADDFLLPLEGRTLRSALATPAPIAGAELRGKGLAFSALKESEDGQWIVARCVNLLADAVEGSWRFGVPPREAHLARLDETIIERLAVAGDAVSFHAPPRGVVTVLIR